MPKPATLLAQADHFIDPSTGAVTPPINAASTYARDEVYSPHQPGLTFSRDGNPTYRQAERVIAKIGGGG